MPLTTNTITLCSTARLVRGINLQYQQHQLVSGNQQWQASEAYTLEQWLDSLIGNALLLGILPSEIIPSTTLSNVAEVYLWEQAITTCLAKHEAAALFDIRAMAKSAIEANILMHNWQITEAEVNHQFITQETRQFLRWRHTFESLCVQQNAIEAARLIALQVELIRQHAQSLFNTLTLPNQIILTGFDRITPLENKFIEVLKSWGIQVETLISERYAHPQINHLAFNDSNAECRAAVAWAQQKLAENPNVQLAIISPVLGNIRRELVDLLDDTFHPETLQASHCERPRCYDFSLGLALTEYPIVHSALQLLRLAVTKTNMNFADVTPILQDVYWGSILELDARAQLDAHVRRNLNASYSLEALIKQVSKLQSNGLQLLTLIEHLGLIARFHSASNSQTNKQSMQRQLPSVWATAFGDLLSELKWADTRAISSHEYQAQQAFFKCLKELAALDAILGHIAAQEAVQKITELCSATMFQAEAIGDIHIQILGLLETPAMQLDAVWALNMNDQHWPPPVKLNPLLPAELQRNRGTPNGSASIQSEFATLVHQRLMLSALEVVFSYALQDGERELRPSPLLESNDLERVNQQLLSSQTPFFIKTLAERLAQPANMQMVDDFMAPKVLDGEKVRGGVSLFARQATCPAWAFYQYRLGAGKLETPIDGLDNIARGNLLHLVLQHFWQACESLANLKGMSSQQRMSAIDAAIEKSIHVLEHQLSFHIPPQVMQIEQQRLQQLMQTWLEVELQRADFKVDACEQRHMLEVDGLSLTLTIDRIDALADGSLVVIDYKTSSLVTNKSWADDRIAEPQLPIYAALALNGEQVVAVCFAKIRTDETKFIGLSAESSVLPAIAALAEVTKSSAFKHFDSWDALLQHWQGSLTNIALEIKSGVASVTFTKESELAYCDVKPLLRLPERLLQFEKMQAALKGGV